MPKLISSVPRCRFHKGTGQSVVRLKGRDIYLGKRGSAASKEAYKRFVAEWSENVGKLSDSPHTTTVNRQSTAMMSMISVVTFDKTIKKECDEKSSPQGRQAEE
jgi:hypothetical protein